MASAAIKLSAILLLVGFCAADIEPKHVVKQVRSAEAGLVGDPACPDPTGEKPVTEVCLGCICQAVSGCKQGLQCEGEACGLFRITWAYWADAGKPTLPGISPESPEGYSSCTNDPGCAALAVQNYMRRFGQDCNGDGAVNCYDYMAIHKLGGYGCTGALPPQYLGVFNQCVAAVAAQQYQG